MAGHCVHCDTRGTACSADSCAAVTSAAYTSDQCHPCWRRLRPRASCRHLGGPTGELVDCRCSSRTKLKVRRCRVHGECTVDRSSLPSCEGCRSFQPSHGVLEAGDALWVNMGAGGLGDGVLGMAAVGGLRRKHPSSRVVYAVGPKALPFVELFDTGAAVVPADIDADGTACAAWHGLQLNRGYSSEILLKSQEPRWQRYCRNAGGVRPHLPTLKDRDGLLRRGSQYCGWIALAPFSAYSDREWPVQHWLELERLLRSRGYSTVVLHDSPERGNRFLSPQLIGADAERVAACVLNCGCLVGCDSGLAHLAGALRVPAVVLCAQTDGRKVFGLYPEARPLSGPLPCSGCYWQPPFDAELCRPRCPSLAAVRPADVLAEVDAVRLPAIACGRTMLTLDKLAALRDALLLTAGLPGDLAELGVCRGGAAKLIGHLQPDARLHLFDTFAGIPEDDSRGPLTAGTFAGDSPAEVAAFLSNPRAVLHVGKFPATAPAELELRFAHIDMDIYQSTRAAIACLAPRLVPGGVLLFDDYGWHDCPGVAQAVHEAGLEPLARPTHNQAVWRKPCTV